LLRRAPGAAERLLDQNMTRAAAGSINSTIRRASTPGLEADPQSAAAIA
jgi:hypothetical protein